MVRSFAEISVGDYAEIEHVVTDSDIEKFVELSGDDNRLHIDKKFAEKTTFKKPVVHGMLGVAFISTIIGTKIPGDGALWYAQNLEFLLPVRVGDTIRIEAEVIKKIDSTNSLELRTDIFNQHKEKVTAGKAMVRLIELSQSDTAEIQQVQHEEVRKVAMVIGATGGIGMATSLQLAKDGFDIVVHYNSNETQAEQIKTQVEAMGRQALCVKANLMDHKSLENLIHQAKRKYNGIGVLVNCAASRIGSTVFADCEWDDFELQLDIAVKGNFYLLKKIIPMMLDQGFGRIIQLVTQAVETPNADWIAYITAKSALVGFSKALAMDLAPKGIQVNMISAGMTDTNLVANIPEKSRMITAAKAPLRRIASPQDVAGAVSFLASDKASYLAGETIRVNGGQVMV